MAVLYVTEVLLYSCFSLLMGAFCIQLVPAHKKPSVLIQERWLYAAIAGIALFAFTPAAVLITELSKEAAFLSMAQTVIFSFTIGKSWAFTFIVAVFFALYLFTFPVLSDKRFTIGALFFTIVLILSIAWSSHAASLTDWSGFLYHAVHFAAVSIWVGVLLMTGWFSKNYANWLAFLKWFSPAAMICFVLTALSGFFMMEIIMDVKEYASSWPINYGQSLLIKHLFVLPVLLFAFINGQLVKRKLQKQEDIDPKPWIKAESLILLLIFAATAFLGQQDPPHAWSEDRYSPLFTYFYNGPIPPAVPIHFGWSAAGIICFFLSAFCLVLCFWAYKKRAALVAFMMSLLLVFSLYLALMTGIS
ncbi:copper resistance D family protein [Domibacillus indicus]|uniref:copper resistance D family protein n=1 Tax=Domibacillus indicus TaxID=1437523 RepID=UPI00061818FF|nr:CopD family protein [Domibacillus indicus]